MLIDHEGAGASVTVKVVGGLGNQLFCFFAGNYLASINSSNLILDMSDIRNGRSQHNVTIESFDIKGRFIGKRGNFIENLATKVSQKAKKFGLLKDSSEYFSNVIGFDPKVSTLPVPVTINGYFQSYKYFYHAKDSLHSLSLRSPSPWFVDLEKFFDSQPVIAVHVRRGDYKSLQDSYGLLSLDYYNACLDKIRATGINLPIYVFSDDIGVAKEILGDTWGNTVNWVEPPQNSDPAESLLLMSRAKVNIIANSTFSWWGAALNRESNVVYAPKKWFKNLPDPELLYPPEWIQVDSFWED